MKKKIENNYPIEDLNKMNSIFKKAVADGQTIEDIYNFYKKYINASAPRPITNCNCHLSVASYFTQLRDFCSKNNQLFK